MIVGDKITFNDCYVNGEFDNENVKIGDEIKLYIDNLIKKTIEKNVPIEAIEIAT